MKLDQRMTEAAEEGKTAEVRKLLQAGSDVNAVDRRGYTALHLAAVYRNLEMVRLLLESGAGVNCRAPETGCTPLYVAAVNGDAKIVGLLLEKGASLESSDTPGMMMNTAAICGHTSVLKLLLDAGAEVDAFCQTPGDTPLQAAALNGQVAAVEVLIKAGADVNVAYVGGGRDAGYTALMNAAKYGYDKIAKSLLLAGADPLMKNAKGQTARDIATAGLEARQRILGMLDHVERLAKATGKFSQPQTIEFPDLVDHEKSE